MQITVLIEGLSERMQITLVVADFLFTIRIQLTRNLNKQLLFRCLKHQIMNKHICLFICYLSW